MKTNSTIIDAGERKEHKEKTFCLCVLCALLRLIRFGCGFAALRSFAAIAVSLLFAGAAAHAQVNSGGEPLSLWF